MNHLNPGLRAHLLAVALSEAPLEAVGLLSRAKGRQEGAGLQWVLRKAQNVSPEPESSFLIAATEQTKLLQSIWRADEELVGLFHSHPASADPTPSERDIAIAESHVKPLTWVIVALGAEDGPRFWVGELP